MSFFINFANATAAGENDSASIIKPSDDDFLMQSIMSVSVGLLCNKVNICVVFVSDCIVNRFRLTIQLYFSLKAALSKASV